MPKYFIITVDTEGDNLWGYSKGDEISVNNHQFIPGFQTMCELYGFKPVYLVNYEMANCDSFVDDVKEWLTKNNCEIGIHLHAWNNPPIFDLKGKYKGPSYLIEYPEDIMRAKFKVIYEIVSEKFNIKPVSHRAGRWAMNDAYFKILNEFGIKVDCSVTPTINWNYAKGELGGGTDYSKSSKNPFFIDNVLEVPVTVRRTRRPEKNKVSSYFRVLFKPRRLWLRPAKQSLDSMKLLIDMVDKENDTNYLEFMIHSSELMPGASKFFHSQDEVNQFNSNIDKVFQYAHEKGYEGITLEEYYNNYINNRFNQ